MDKSKNYENILTSDEFHAIKEWYLEWKSFPKYLATVSLAFLAFSLTELIPPENHNKLFLHIGWIFLGMSVVLSFTAMLLAYSAYDFWIRIYLRNYLKSLHIKHPKKNTMWISILGKISYLISFVAMIFLLVGAFCVGLHVMN